MNAPATGTASAAELEAARLLLARMGITPAELLTTTPARPPAPTFAEYVPVVSAAVSDGTRRVYGSYWKRVVAGDQQKAGVTPTRGLGDERGGDLLGGAELGDRRAGRLGRWEAGREVLLPGLGQAVGEFVDHLGGKSAGECPQVSVDQDVAGHGRVSSRVMTVVANSRQLLRSACSRRSPAGVSR